MQWRRVEVGVINNWNSASNVNSLCVLQHFCTRIECAIFWKKKKNSSSPLSHRKMNESRRRKTYFYDNERLECSSSAAAASPWITLSWVWRNESSFSPFSERWGVLEGYRRPLNFEHWKTLFSCLHNRLQQFHALFLLLKLLLNHFAFRAGVAQRDCQLNGNIHQRTTCPPTFQLDTPPHPLSGNSKRESLFTESNY